MNHIQTLVKTFKFILLSVFPILFMLLSLNSILPLKWQFTVWRLSFHLNARNHATVEERRVNYVNGRGVITIAMDNNYWVLYYVKIFNNMTVVIPYAALVWTSARCCPVTDQRRGTQEQAFSHWAVGTRIVASAREPRKGSLRRLVMTSGSESRNRAMTNYSFQLNRYKFLIPIDISLLFCSYSFNFRTKGF